RPLLDRAEVLRNGTFPGRPDETERKPCQREPATVKGQIPKRHTLTSRKAPALWAICRVAPGDSPAIVPPLSTVFGANSMNIHEYQGKEVLRGFGVRVPRGKPAFTVEEAVAAAEALGGPVWVVKAQIHAGGRGKGGGVKVVKSIEDVKKE